MSARVAQLPSLPSASAVKNGRPVSGRDMVSIARALNWSNGRGCTLIPLYNPGTSIASGVARTYHFKLFCRVQAIARIWCLRLRRDAVSFVVGSAAYATITLPSGATHRVEMRSPTRRAEPIFLVEKIAVPAAGAVDAALVITVNASEANPLFVEGIGCYELPRSELDESALTDNGVDIETCRSGEPIYDLSVKAEGVLLSNGGESFGAIARAAKAAETRAHRGSLHTWAVPDEDALTTTSTSFSDIFLAAPRVLATKIYRADVTKRVTVYARVLCSSGPTAGQIKATSRTGDTVTISIPTSTTTAAWFSGTVLVDCEDVTAFDGRQSSAWEEPHIEWKRTAGAGSMALSALVIGDG